MCLGYMAPLFQAFFGDGSRLGLQLDYIVEKHPRGTAGAIYDVPNLEENFLVINGDTLTDLSFGSLLKVQSRLMPAPRFLAPK
jgi:mannose-1-phosphate guanylyltransferase